MPDGAPLCPHFPHDLAAGVAGWVGISAAGYDAARAPVCTFGYQASASPCGDLAGTAGRHGAFWYPPEQASPRQFEGLARMAWRRLFDRAAPNVSLPPPGREELAHLADVAGGFVDLPGLASQTGDQRGGIVPRSPPPNRRWLTRKRKSTQRGASSALRRAADCAARRFCL